MQKRNYAKLLTPMMPSSLSPLNSPGSVKIVTSLDIQDQNVLPLLPSHDACGLRNRHLELKQKTQEQQIWTQSWKEQCDAESKLKVFCRSLSKVSTWYFCNDVSQTKSLQFNQVKWLHFHEMERFLDLMPARTGNCQFWSNSTKKKRWYLLE